MRWTGAGGVRTPVIMTNRIAFVLCLILVAIVAVDLVLGLGGVLFLARRFLELLDRMAFWR
jgi:hypothetical protein